MGEQTVEIKGFTIKELFVSCSTCMGKEEQALFSRFNNKIKTKGEKTEQTK